MFYLDLVIEVFVVSWVSLQGKFWEILELLWAMNGPLLLKILLKHQTASELIHQSNLPKKKKKAVKSISVLEKLFYY